MSDTELAEEGLRVARLNGLTLTDLSHYARALLDQWLQCFPEKSPHDATMRQWWKASAAVNPFLVMQLIGAAHMGARMLPSRGLMRELIAENRLLSSEWMASTMEMIGRLSPECDKLIAFNDKLYTHNSDGSLNRMTSDNILPLFAKGKKWPNIVLTANHALTRDSDDMSGIMRNISAMVRHTYHRHHLPYVLERHPDKVTEAGGKTIIIGAVHSSGNWHLNAASLLHRYNFLEKHSGMDTRMRYQGLPALDGRRNRQLDKNKILPAGYCGASPSSIRLAKLIMRVMAEDPSRVNLDEVHSIGELAQQSGKAEPIILRDDAREIIRHFTGDGYSKAGMTVSEIGTYLAYELSATGPDKKPLFAIRNEHGKAVPMNKKILKEILSGFPAISAGGAIAHRTEEEKALGISRYRINSHADLVTGHFITRERSRYRDFDPDDAPHMVHGTEEGGGHSPRHALGFELEEGYLHANPEVVRDLGKIFTRNSQPAENKATHPPVGSATAALKAQGRQARLRS